MTDSALPSSNEASINQAAPSAQTAPSYSLNFPYAYGKPTKTAEFRTSHADFIVDEVLGFQPLGTGEHIYVHIEKKGENTGWVAGKLARFFDVKSLDVSYSGMKDRHAITRQWFSIYAPKFQGDIDWQAFVESADANIQVLAASRHTQKLRRGMHEKNRFTITLRNIADKEEVQARLQRIAETGVPNYFGEQRFGRDGQNMQNVAKWVETGVMPGVPKFKPGRSNKGKGRGNKGGRNAGGDAKGILMSSARSYLFNVLLGERVQQGNWYTALTGDVIEQNSPTASLWGRGRSSLTEDALAIEQAVCEPHQLLLERLEHCGLNHERRKHILLPENLRWEWDASNLTLDFALEPGAFATSLLRELVDLVDLSLVVPNSSKLSAE